MELPIIAYPETARGEVSEEQFGVAVTDPYRWLENDVRSDQRVRDWVTAQNAVTTEYLATLGAREAIATRLTELMNYERIDVPVKRGNRYFYTRNDGLQNQDVLYMREGLDGAPRALIDPNSWSDDDATAMAQWLPSPDGSRIVYAIQDGGTDWRTLQLFDVTTGETLADEIEWAKFTNLSWSHDGAGFYYSRFPAPVEGAAFQALNTNQAIYYHRVGTSQDQDVLAYATPDRPELGHFGEVTDDGRYLVIYSSEGTDDRYEVHVVDLRSEGSAPQTVFEGHLYNWDLAGSDGDTFYWVTNNGAPRQRLVTMDVSSADLALTEIIAEDEATLESASLVGGSIIVNYLVDARNEARIYDLSGNRTGTVGVPGLGSIAGFDGEIGDPETFFSFNSFARPTTIYRFDSSTGAAEPFAEPEVSFDPEDFVVSQHFYPSRDGTQIPMFVVRRQDLDTSTSHPTLLYGYGGFNISQGPSFNAARLQWVEMGGVFVIANIRGGGEYGAEWHDGGRLLNKQNVFDDFIAAGEFLISEGITTRNQLAIQGRSNGGLLVGAVVNQRPDLFAAALPAVGVMDMLRFDRFTAGRYWVDDYGYPNREADFANLLAYSPYHNIPERGSFPAILVTTADTDDRVVPGHSFKYTAALQRADLGNRPRLIRVETRAGHGSGRPTDQIIAEYADLWAFIGHWTGLEWPAED
jgi:prolyl oligopeptidase